MTYMNVYAYFKYDVSTRYIYLEYYIHICICVHAYTSKDGYKMVSLY